MSTHYPTPWRIEWRLIKGVRRPDTTSLSIVDALGKLVMFSVDAKLAADIIAAVNAQPQIKTEAA